jgi:DNA-binding SARP family transcriptional activator
MSETLWLHVLGPFAVIRADGPEAIQIGSRKARTLLAMLAMEPRRLVRVDPIVAALWRDGGPWNATANVATLVSRLRRTLGSDAVLGDRAGYRLGERVRVDLCEAAVLVRRAEECIDRGTPAAALTAAEPALRLLDRGGVLDNDPHAEWASMARAQHAVLLRRARHAVAEAAMSRGATRTARTVAEEAVIADPFDEAAHRILMMAYSKTGEPAHAVTTYQRLRTVLGRELGIKPAGSTQALYEKIRTGGALVGPRRQ